MPSRKLHPFERQYGCLGRRGLHSIWLGEGSGMNQDSDIRTTEAYEQQLTSIWASICAALDHIEDKDIGGATLILQTVLKKHFGAIRATPWTSSRRTSGAP